MSLLLTLPPPVSCSDPDQQHNGGHQHFMGDPHPHGSSAKERDGDPQHNHRGPPPEGLGTLNGPEELHCNRRSANNNGCLSANLYLTRIWVFSKGDKSVLHSGPSVTPERLLRNPSASLVGPEAPSNWPSRLLICSKHWFGDLRVKMSKLEHGWIWLHIIRVQLK